MYFIVSWDISASEPSWSQVNEQMKNCFKKYAQVRPVNTYYMVKLPSVDHYNQIHNCFLAIAQRDDRVSFIMSPVLTVGNYKGWLPQSVWNKIHEVID